jgi:hypothetical protein
MAVLAPLVALLALAAVLAVVGRTAQPARERLPWHELGPADLLHAVVAGVLLVEDHHERWVAGRLTDPDPERRAWSARR